MFKIRGLVLDLLHLVLEISSNPTPAAIHEGLRVFEILLEESLEVGPRQGTHGLASALVLVPTKADPTTKE